MTISDDILAYHDTLSEEDRAIGEVLAGAIDAALGKRKGATCKVWHRHPVWFLDGNPIVGYHRLKTPTPTHRHGCIRLLFWSGESFEEPGLAKEGGFKTAGARYASADEIVMKDLKRWLKKSIEIQWDYKNIVKRKGKLVRL